MCNKCDCKTDAPEVLIPFDLEAAKSGAPIRTRGGEKAIYIGYARGFVQPVIATIESIEQINRFNLDGTFFREGQESIMDLFMAPKPKATRTRTIYLARGPFGVLHLTLKALSKSQGWEVLGSKEVTLTEGEFHDSENT